MCSDIISLINSHYNGLTKQGKKIANFIYQTKSEVQYLSITSLAEQCGVAEATVFRFCKALGFNGYNELKLAVAISYAPSDNDDDESSYKLYGQVQPSDTIMDMCRKLYNSNVEALTQTMDLVNEASIVRAGELLSAASHVYCLGQGGSLLIAMEAWGRFTAISNKFHTVEDSHLQAVTCSLLGESDVILFFSYSGATKDMLDILRPAKNRGTKVILVTHYSNSPAAAFANVILLCGSSEGPLQQGSVAAKMASLFVIDVLYNQFCRTNFELATRNIEITASAIANKLL